MALELDRLRRAGGLTVCSAEVMWESITCPRLWASFPENLLRNGDGVGKSM